MRRKRALTRLLRALRRETAADDDLEAFLHFRVLAADLGALAIALLKASLVVIYFMGVRYNTPLTKVVAIAGFFWLFILFGLTLNDYLTRGWLGVPGR